MFIRVEFSSALEMLDLVQTASERILRPFALDDDTQLQVAITIRESVINAIRHGNQSDIRKHVIVELVTDSTPDSCELTIRVRDHGEGFDPASVPDPLAPENLLKANGRGMLMIRSFMDDVQVGPAPGGGTEVRMVKRIALARAPSDLQF